MTEIFNLFLKKLGEAFTQEMAFTKVFNLSIKSFDAKKVVMTFPMSAALHGNMLQNILHGGAIATVLDSAGGMVAIAAGCAKDPEAPIEQQLARIAHAATVDFRVDYLRPGRGESFWVEANLLRAGNKITVVRSELYNDQDLLLATCIATYVVG